MPEVIPIGADHAGFELKERLVEELRSARLRAARPRHRTGPESTDYPDYAHPVASQVEQREAKRGVLLCGTGLGMSYAANRHPGVRAAVAWTPEIAALAREHNDANVLVLPARFVTRRRASTFSGVARHRSRAGATAAGSRRSSRSTHDLDHNAIAARRRSRHRPI